MGPAVFACTARAKGQPALMTPPLATGGCPTTSHPTSLSARIENASLSEQPGQLLTVTTDPRLDQAAAQSALEWEASARKAGLSRTANWLARRMDDPAAVETLEEALDQLLNCDEPGDLAVARIELAEFIEDGDDLLAETLLEAVRVYARKIEDGEMLASVTAQLAGVAERQGDALTAVEYHVDFLNWRRQQGHVSDPEDVQSSFEEVLRYAEADREPGATALYTYRQAAFTRLANAGDDRASEGEWEQHPTPYESWA